MEAVCSSKTLVSTYLALQPKRPISTAHIVFLGKELCVIALHCYWQGWTEHVYHTYRREMHTTFWLQNFGEMV